MTKRGHNAIKGKQGFQPIRSANPPRSLTLPNLPTSASDDISLAAYTGPGMDNSIENGPRMRDAETRPAAVHIDNYTWGHAFIHSNGALTIDEKAERYGNRIAIAAYGAKLDKAIETNRTAEPNAEFHKSISGDVNGAARLIARDQSGRYPANVVAAAERIHHGHIADGKLNPHAIEVENASDTPDKHYMVFSKDAIAVLRAASGEARNPDERTKALIEENENLAEQQKEYFRNPTRANRPAGTDMSAFPQPSEALVSERKKLIRTQSELQEASSALQGNKNPFSRKKKETAVTELQSQVSRVNDRVRYLEKQ